MLSYIATAVISASSAVHYIAGAYIGHIYEGHNDKGHNYKGNNYKGHHYEGHNCIDYIGLVRRALRSRWREWLPGIA